MSVSIQELDNTVRAFYEGKGDLVRHHNDSANMYDFSSKAWVANFTMRLSVQQKQAQQTLTEVSISKPQHSMQGH